MDLSATKVISAKYNRSRTTLEQPMNFVRRCRRLRRKVGNIQRLGFVLAILGACGAAHASSASMEGELYDLARNLLTATKAANENPSSWSNHPIEPDSFEKSDGLRLLPSGVIEVLPVPGRASFRVAVPVRVYYSAVLGKVCGTPPAAARTGLPEDFCTREIGDDGQITSSLPIEQVKSAVAAGNAEQFRLRLIELQDAFSKDAGLPKQTIELVIRRGTPELLRVLEQTRPDFFEQFQKTSDTPIIWALSGQSLAKAQLLLEHYGVDAVRQQASVRGLPMLQAALKIKMPDGVAFIEALGVKPNVVDKSGGWNILSALCGGAKGNTSEAMLDWFLSENFTLDTG
jgi:hypothetical protein